MNILIITDTDISRRTAQETSRRTQTGVNVWPRRAAWFTVVAALMQLRDLSAGLIAASFAGEGKRHGEVLRHERLFLATLKLH